MSDTTIQDFLNSFPIESDRAAIIIEHPNGLSTMFFDTQGGMLFSVPSYVDLFTAFKTSLMDYEMNDAVNDAKTRLIDEDFLVFELVYPGIYDIDELTTRDDNEYIVAFHGEMFPVDSILTTDLPIM